MEKLRSTEPSYIRCVKPNSQKLPEVFDSIMSLQQLTYAGLSIYILDDILKKKITIIFNLLFSQI